MSGFALLGGWTVGRNVVATMGGRIVPSSLFSPEASIAVLFFIGGALLLSNLAGVPASTSMTAVGAIAGLGLAKSGLNWAVMGQIVSWWIVAPVIAFWTGGVIGRYLYAWLSERVVIDRSAGSLFARKGEFPWIGLGEGTRFREAVGGLFVVVIGCFMAFSAGASNVANAVAPLVGSGELALGMNRGILLAAAAIGLGAFTIARRTLDTVGKGITDLPILAAMIVSVVSAAIITMLSWMGIPASLAISSTMCIAGLGWGRATRAVTLSETLQGTVPEAMSAGALKEDAGEMVAEDGGDAEALRLFDPSTIGKIVTMWILTPTISAGAAFVVFRFLL
jgi:PiT family inorganic phosphate transporter